MLRLAYANKGAALLPEVQSLKRRTLSKTSGSVSKRRGNTGTLPPPSCVRHPQWAEDPAAFLYARGDQLGRAAGSQAARGGHRGCRTRSRTRGFFPGTAARTHPARPAWIAAAAAAARFLDVPPQAPRSRLRARAEQSPRLQPGPPEVRLAGQPRPGDVAAGQRRGARRGALSPGEPQETARVNPAGQARAEAEEAQERKPVGRERRRRRWRSRLPWHEEPAGAASTPARLGTPVLGERRSEVSPAERTPPRLPRGARSCLTPKGGATSTRSSPLPRWLLKACHPPG